MSEGYSIALFGGIMIEQYHFAQWQKYLITAAIHSENICPLFGTVLYVSAVLLSYSVPNMSMK